MRQLYPEQREVLLEDIAADCLAAQVPRDDTHPFIRAVMIASIDGAVRGESGTSTDLTNAEDLAMLGLMRACSDAVLVGAATVRAYPYRPPRPNPRWSAMRNDAGMSDAPRLVVVTRTGIAADNPCLADPQRPPLFVVPGSCPNLGELAERAEVMVAGEDDVDMTVMAAQLRERGHIRISCEGGPGLLDALAAHGLVDEFCLTTAPVWLGGADLRLSGGPSVALASAFDVRRLILGENSYVYTQWRARRG